MGWVDSDLAWIDLPPFIVDKKGEYVRANGLIFPLNVSVPFERPQIIVDTPRNISEWQYFWVGAKNGNTVYCQIM